MSEENNNTPANLNEEDETIPLLFQNMKKAFGENIIGPIRNSNREYKFSVKSAFLFEVIAFLSIRGGSRLAAINAWETELNFVLAYHFINQIGKEFYDTKLSLIVNIPKNQLKVRSITKLFENATIFEKEINDEWHISFEDT